jgi:uncharacterized membrane protein (TIGR02234 family)
MSARREYASTLVAAAIGAGLILLVVRRTWARVTFVPPRPLPAQVIDVSGQDLVPLAGALALAALACLAAVIATRGIARRVAGVVLAVFGAWAGIAAMAEVTPASATSVAASKVGSPAASAASGAVGSTTSGSTSSGGDVVVSGTTSHVLMSGGEWKALVLLGAMVLVLTGIAVAWRGPRWAVMSARYDSPGHEPAGYEAASRRQAADSASMWESLSRGTDPTEASPDDAGPGSGPADPGAGPHAGPDAGPDAGPHAGPYAGPHAGGPAPATEPEPVRRT